MTTFAIASRRLCWGLGVPAFEMYAIVCHEFESSENSDIGQLETGGKRRSLVPSVCNRKL